MITQKKKLGLILLLIAVLTLAWLPQAAQAVSPNDGFNPNVNYYVSSLAIQPDGKILIGGWFTTVGGVARNRIARLNSDGSLDTTFDPNANSIVDTLAIQPDGKILIGGDFTTIGGVTRNRIARLNSDGSLDTSFNPNAGKEVISIAIQSDGKILVGGHFAIIGGAARNYVARLNSDGSADASFNPNANNLCYSIAIQPDGKVLIGGSFTTLAGVARNHIARLNIDGSLDTSFDPNAGPISSDVHSMAIQPDGKILIGGWFTTVSGVARTYMARLNIDGSLDTSFNSNVHGSVDTMAIQPDGKILIGGGFTGIGVFARNHIARLNSDGSLDTTSFIGAGADSSVDTVAVQSDGKMLIGGYFTTIGGVGSNYIARLNADGSLDASFNPNANGAVYSSAMQPDGKILIGGAFTAIGGVARNYVARLNADGSLDASFNPNANSYVMSITIQSDGKILLGGWFTTIGGVARNSIARLNPDGSLDPSFNPNAGTDVESITIQSDGKILIGGAFTTIGGVARNRIARLNPDSSLDTSFDPNANNNVHASAIQSDGKILIGGAFTTIGGVARNRIARLNPDGSLDTSFDPNSTGNVYSLAMQSDGKILMGGAFTTIGGVARNRIARLNPDGSLDTSFDPNANGELESVAIQTNGKILIGGWFTTVGGAVRNYIARLNIDGSLDTSFNPNANNRVWSLSIQPDGKIMVGGYFTAIGGIARNYVARLTNTDAAQQDVFVNATGTKATWNRSGSGPEVWRVIFEQSTDGTNWTSLGTGTRISGGWNLAGLNIPFNQNFYIRARGYAQGGYFNSSGSVIESVKIFYIADVMPPTTTASAPGYTIGTWSGSGSIGVTLSASDGTGSGVAAGYPKYCVDTTNTCTPDITYSTAFNVGCSVGSTCIQYVRYQSVDNAGNIETVESSVVKQDLQRPVTVASPAGGIYSSAQSVTFSCSDGTGSGCAGIYYCTGAGCTPTTQYIGAIRIASSTDLRFYSFDSDGNTETVKTVSYVISFVPPTVTDIFLDNMKTQGPHITWNTVSNATTYNIYRSFDGGTWTLIGSVPHPGTSFTDASAPQSNTVYYWTVTAQNSQGESAKLSVLASRTALRPGWNMISAPFNISGSQPMAVYGAWANWVWGWQSASNVNPDTSGSWVQNPLINTGFGQFLWANGDSTVLLASGLAGPFPLTINLSPGWNMVATQSQYYVTGIGTNWTLDEGAPLVTAITNNIIGGSLYYWNGSTYDLLNITLDNPVIEPWKSYWILNMDSVSHTLTMQ